MTDDKYTDISDNSKLIVLLTEEILNVVLNLHEIGYLHNDLSVATILVDPKTLSVKLLNWMNATKKTETNCREIESFPI